MNTSLSQISLEEDDTGKSFKLLNRILGYLSIFFQSDVGFAPYVNDLINGIMK